MLALHIVDRSLGDENFLIRRPTEKLRLHERAILEPILIGNYLGRRNFILEWNFASLQSLLGDRGRSESPAKLNIMKTLSSRRYIFGFPHLRSAAWAKFTL